MISEILTPKDWGSNTISLNFEFIVPATGQVVPGDASYARFRLNYEQGVNPISGGMDFGEVEAYGITQSCVPEPTTIVLLGIGLLILGVTGKKKIKS